MSEETQDEPPPEGTAPAKEDSVEKEDHDQRFKKTLKDNFPDFIKMFFPQYFDAIDFDSVVWRDKELYVGEPIGDKVILDTVAHVKTKISVDPDRPDQREWYAIIHIEIESRGSTDLIDQRIVFYYMMLMFEFGVPILPIVLFIKMNKEGIGQETLIWSIFNTKVMEFTYNYVALGGLDPLEYLEKEFPLGWALTSLMKKGKHDPIQVATQAVNKLNTANITDLNRTRLKDILESYFQGTEDQIQEVKKMWRIDPAPKLVPDNESTLARVIRELNEAMAARDEATAARDEATAARDEAEIRGQINSRRDSIRRLIEKRFGENAAQVVASKIDAITEMDKLNIIFDEAITTSSVEELRKLFV